MVSEWRDPVYGGGQIHVHYLCTWLVKDHGCTVDLYVRALRDDAGKAYACDESLLDGRWNIFRTGVVSSFFSVRARLLWLVQITRILYRQTKKKKYDLIHWHALLPWLPIKIVSILTGVPCVYTVHGTMHLDTKKRWLFSNIEKFLVCTLAYTLEISVSSNIFSYEPRSKKIEIIYNGVDIDALDALPAKEKYQQFTFLTVGRMDRQKNHQIILDAIKHLWKQYCIDNNIQFVWVWDGVLFEQLKQQIVAAQLEDVILMLGKLPYNQTLEVFKKAHVFLLPSLGEWQPLTVLEAFASHLPVIATDVWDNRFFVQNKKNGLLLSPWSLEDLELAIQSCVEQWLDQTTKWWEYAYLFVQDYSWKQCVNRTINAYKSLC